MKEYKTIYRPYEVSKFITDASGQIGGSFGEGQATNFDNAINKHANDGWNLRNSGGLVSGRDIIFWALMERDTPA